MNPRTSHLEETLARLGKAHRDGAFSADATPYPWRTEEPEVASPTHRRFDWGRVAIPLAAAAAAAVLFVGPALQGPPAVHEVADNALDTVTTDRQVQSTATEPVTSASETADCDYNGDGTIDGKDIQAFVNSLRKNTAEYADAGLEAEYLQRCLLGD